MCRLVYERCKFLKVCGHVLELSHLSFILLFRLDKIPRYFFLSACGISTILIMALSLHIECIKFISQFIVS